MNNFIKSRPKTIFTKLFNPIMSVLVLQAVFFVGIYLLGGIQGQLDRNAVEILKEKTINRRIYLETEMNGRWSNIMESYEKVLGAVEDALKEHNAAYSDLKTDAGLNEIITQKVTPSIIYMIRKNSVTGGFFVLDGLGNEQIEDSYSGIYLRNPNPKSYSTDNTDIMVEYGMPEISKKMGLPLDSYWNAYFTLQEDNPSDAYFFKPLRAAQENPGTNQKELGYWAPLFRLNDEDISVVTYSIPLIAGDGTVFGVMGVEISERQMASTLPYDELAERKEGGYFLGLREPDGYGYRKMITKGPIYQINFGSKKDIKTEPTGYQGVVGIHGTTEVGRELYGSVQDLKIYGNNSPYEQEKWVLIGMVGTDDLFSFSYGIRNNIFLCVLLSFGVGFISVLLANRRVVQPITMLMKELKAMNPYKKIELQPTNIGEVDELAATIEDLSVAVAESSSKLTKIISMTGLHIGAFEYKETGDYVFCNDMLIKLLNLELPDWDGSFIEINKFKEKMDALEACRIKDGGGLLKLDNIFGQDQYIRVRYEENKQTILGTAIDVTKEILEKKRIEMERDYDGLTGLYNQSAFRRNAEELFHGGESMKSSVMIMWDLDNLKYINDNYGHETGDYYIRSLAEQLELFQKSGGIVARRSGDEFLTFLQGYGCREELEKVVNGIWLQLKNVTIPLPDRKFFKLKVSAGMAWYPDDAKNLDELIRYADFAMYCVKHNKKGNIQSFDKKQYEDNGILINGQEALHDLIDRRLIEYAMQPILEAATGQVYGYEMLMRPMVEPFRCPADVLRIAKAQSKLYEIERLTLFMGMETYVTHIKNGSIDKGCKVFINSIADQILSAEDEELLIRLYKDDISALVLEITEGEPLNQVNTSAKLKYVKKWNAQVAIDDFGSGYSSESVLLYISPDVVKVDMSIVRGIDKDLNRVTLLQNLLSYAKPRGISILAEGVETVEEMRVLVQNGVEYLQGYYIGKPNILIQGIESTVKEEVQKAYLEIV